MAVLLKIHSNSKRKYLFNQRKCDTIIKNNSLWSAMGGLEHEH